MARVENHTVLADLRSARSFGEQILALRSLKNEIVGHVQRKEKWVESGVLEPVVRILANSRSPAQANGKDTRSHGSPCRTLTEQETVRVQALQILASLANGGFAFLAPIHAAGALSAILSNISPIDNPPQVIVAALKAVINITKASSLALPTSTIKPVNLADIAFVPQMLDAFCAILTAKSSSDIVQTQNLVASLVGRLCKEERHQIALADCGILDALATRLASVVVARGHVIPGAENTALIDGIADLIPEAAPPGTDLTVILEALSAILGDSRWRASMLVYAPAMLAIFPHIKLPGILRDVKATLQSFETAGLNHTRPEELGVMDCLLPIVPEYPAKGPAVSSYPHLGTFTSRDSLASLRPSSTSWISSPFSWDSAPMDTLTSNSEGEVKEPESPLVPWLIFTARLSIARHGMEGVMAASILTCLFKAGFSNKSREACIGQVVIPPLIRTLEEAKSKLTYPEALMDDELTRYWSFVERIPTILAKLLTDSEFLQKCAFDCQADKTISGLLKGAYDPLPIKTSRLWSPTAHHDGTSEREMGLGPRGQTPLHAHRIRVREATLKAICALGAYKEEYRKALADQDIVPYIVQSLSATPSKPKHTKDRPKSPKGARTSEREDGVAPVNAAYGANPISVIVSACDALRTLSRSVSILRTTLEDNSVANPVFHLLRHREIEVQVAALALMCNLITEAAPMKERIQDAGVMEILCEKAHSLNASLRLNAVWALKHFIDGVDIETKKACLEELSSGWLVQLIIDDTEDNALYKRTKNEKQMGQSSNDMDDDVEMVQAEEESRSRLSTLLPRTITPRSGSKRYRTPRMRQNEQEILKLREAELNPVRKAREDDLAVQEQGLNFIRNLIGRVSNGHEASTRDNEQMIDHIFNVLGQDRLFEILASKIQVKHLHPFDRRFSTGHEPRTLYPQAKIVEAVVFVLVHLAASTPRHRQIITSQTKLLQDLTKHFHSKDKLVRGALCHLMINLTWVDEHTEEEGSQQRANELKRLGVMKKLETLEQEDSELDVRERAKAAIWQMKRSKGF